jgi:hypothetical protein
MAFVAFIKNRRSNPAFSRLNPFWGSSRLRFFVSMLFFNGFDVVFLLTYQDYIYHLCFLLFALDNGQRFAAVGVHYDV